MKPIIFHPEAEDELFSSIEYYNSQAAGLGLEFYENIKGSIKHINDFPEAWQIVKNKVRNYILKRFPFKIYFIDDPDKIYIIAIAHFKKDPSYWEQRLQDIHH